MSDYTPETEDVQTAYGKRAVLGTPAMAANYEEAEAQFDHWLASVKAEVWDEVASAIRRCDPKCTDDCDVCVFRGDVLADITPNPYREGER